MQVLLIVLAILKRNRKVFKNFIINLEDFWKIKFVFYQTLITFFHTGKPVLSRVLIETLHSDEFYMLYVPNLSNSPDRIWLLAKKEVSDNEGLFLLISSKLNKARC